MRPMVKKLLYLLLAVSLGMNAGLVVVTLFHRGLPPRPDGPPDRFGPPPRGPEGPDGPDGPGGRPFADQQPDPRHLIDGHIQGMTRQLDLAPEQQQRIREILQRYLPDLMRLHERRAAAERDLSRSYAATDFDAARFRQLAAAASRARAELDSLSAVALVAEAAVLTTPQRVRYAEVAPSLHSQPGPPPERDGPRR